MKYDIYKILDERKKEIKKKINTKKYSYSKSNNMTRFLEDSYSKNNKYRLNIIKKRYLKIKKVPDNIMSINVFNILKYLIIINFVFFSNCNSITINTILTSNLINYKLLSTINACENLNNIKVNNIICTNDVSANFRCFNSNGYYYIFFEINDKYTIELDFNDSMTNTSYIFENNPLIEKIDLGKFDMSNIEIADHMFDSCKFMTDVYNFSIENTRDMSYFFVNCISLKNIELNLSYNEEIQNMEYFFYNCNSLTSLELELNSSSLTNMRYMFAECTFLTSVNLNIFNASNLQNLEYLFYNCDLLTEVTLDIHDAYNLQNIQYMFGECHSLENISFNEFITSELKQMNHMFYNCSKLKMWK
jgi:hypothetical protein